MTAFRAMEPAPFREIVDEARRLTAAALERDIQIRLLGGIAVRIRVDDAFHPALSREYKDIDFVAPKGSGKKVADFFTNMGYEPNREFNAFNGGQRLLFYDVANERQLDVFIGAFRMCHEIPITDRITNDPITVPLAELLLTKLQIVTINEKDVRDVAALLHHHAIADRDGDAINGPRVAKLCAEDWGLWRTCKMTLQRVRDGLALYDITKDEREGIEKQIDTLWQQIDAEPKSRSWRLRDRIGDRKRWYDEPEEVEA